MKVAGVWRCVYWAVDDDGQVVDVMVSKRRDIAAGTRFFTRAIAAQGEPDVVVTDRAPSLANVIADLLPGALQHRQVRQQSDRVRPRTIEGSTTADSRVEDGPDRSGVDLGSRVHSEPSTWPLRTRRRAPAIVCSAALPRSTNSPR